MFGDGEQRETGIKRSVILRDTDAGVNHCDGLKRKICFFAPPKTIIMIKSYNKRQQSIHESCFYKLILLGSFFTGHCLKWVMYWNNHSNTTSMKQRSASVAPGLLVHNSILSCWRRLIYLCHYSIKTFVSVQGGHGWLAYLNIGP